MPVTRYPQRGFRKSVPEEAEHSGAAAPSAAELPESSNQRVGLFVSLVQHGESVRGAARRSGLSAEQVLEWLEDDSLMAEELEAARERIEKQVRFRLTALAHTAVDTVERALAKGDARVAIDVLLGLGVIPGSSSSTRKS